MKKHIITLLALLLGINCMNANPIDLEKAKTVGQKFACAKFNKELKSNDLSLVYTGTSHRGETCFYVFNTGEQGFVIVSADDRFRPIVGYSDERPFETENMSPELAFYLDKIMEARSSDNVVLFDDTAEEWRSVMATGKLLSRNRGRGVDYLVSTIWNQDSPYNYYAPEASNGPGGRCYAGCVATAMSQIMKYWDYPEHGTGSHTYNSGGWWGPYYPNLNANFGATYYDWDNMPIRITSGSPQEQIEAVATLMYHCGVSVNMGFAYDGSGANSEDVPGAIQQYFSYSSHADLKRRESYSLTNWQNMLKESFDIGWPVYYSGYSDEGGHAFVCDGYDDDDLFHYNWGWGGRNDGWFVIDEIDYANWAGAIFNFVPTNVYSYMPLQPDNFSVEPSGDFDYAATLQWTNPSQNVHFNNLSSLDRIVVTRNGEIIYTNDNVAPGATMTYTDHYMPAVVDYAVYAISHDAKGLEAVENRVVLGPVCNWTIEMTSSSANGWNDGGLSLVNQHGDEITYITLHTTSATQTVSLPQGHIDIKWIKPSDNIGQMGFVIKNSFNDTKVSFSGSSSDISQGLFFIANNNCEKAEVELDGPENLTASQSGNSVTLLWEAVNREIIHYQVFRDNLLLATTNETHFTYTEEAATFHNYHVVAFTTDGETRPSNVCNLQPSSEYMMPTNLRYEMTAPTKARISWDAPQGEGLRGYMVYRRPKGGEFKRVKMLSSTSFIDNLTAQADSHFEYIVCACYTNQNIPSAYASSQEHPELNFIEVNKTIIPQHLSFFIHEGNVILEWQEATMADSYNIYRNGHRIAQGIHGTSFVDYDATSNQTYHYTVTGCTDFIESSTSNEVYVDWTTGVGEQGVQQALSLYPNPTEGKVFVEAEGLRQVRVFNLMGQEVLNQAVEGDRFILDLSEQPTGCYFIEVTREQGCEINKILKIK
jgi:fibronectin type 3 domain-containing protein